jgi:hypothetical protein
MHGWESPRGGKLDEELPKPSLVLADVGINLSVSTLEVSPGSDGWAPVPGAGDVASLRLAFAFVIPRWLRQCVPGEKRSAPVFEWHVKPQVGPKLAAA